MEPLTKRSKRTTYKRPFDVITCPGKDDFSFGKIGEILVSFNRLVTILGSPSLCDANDDKVDAQWFVRFNDNGEECSIYNFKDGVKYMEEEGTPTKDIFRWNVGGRSPNVLGRVHELLRGSSPLSVEVIRTTIGMYPMYQHFIEPSPDYDRYLIDTLKIKFDEALSNEMNLNPLI
jgi:hypothetical protein